MTPLLVALQLAVPLGLDRYVPAPDDNPIRADRAKVGRLLFFDKALARDSTIACANCHPPERAFADDRKVAVGLGGAKGFRRTPTILNRAWGKSFFWDGRAPTLEDQVLQPILNPIEMNMTIEELLPRLAKDPRYPKLDPTELARSLATYVRTILAGDSPYDRYVAGDRAALTLDQIAGLRLFRGKAGCAVCHLGPNLTDELFHNTGVSQSDHGRNTVTNRPEDVAAFKTPTLREVARRPPYMHDGSLATFQDVIEHYDQGGKPASSLDPEIRKLGLTPPEKQQLAAFLRALTGTVREGMGQ